MKKISCAPIEIPSTSFSNSPKKSNVSFSGKLLLDDSEDGYIDVVDGAEINIEINYPAAS